MNAKNTPMTMASSVEPRAKMTVLPMTAQVVGLVQALTRKSSESSAGRAVGPMLSAVAERVMPKGATTTGFGENLIACVMP